MSEFAEKVENRSKCKKQITIMKWYVDLHSKLGKKIMFNAAVLSSKLRRIIP